MEGIPTNEWVAKSIKLANQSDYLDRLHEVYPFDYGAERDIEPELLAAIQRAHKAKDAKGLVMALLDLERFPLEHPSAALLRRRPGLADKNPKTIRRVAEPFLQMSGSTLVTLCMKPKSPNTQVGPMFRTWLRKVGYPFVGPDAFSGAQRTISDGDVLFLDGTDPDLKHYANDALECAVGKGTDLVFRVGRQVFIGTAKWHGSPGGNQDNAFDEAMKFVGGHIGKAKRIAVIDGYPWTEPGPKGDKMQIEVRNTENAVMSALLLRDYIRSVG